MLNDEKRSRGRYNVGDDRDDVPRHRGGVLRGDTGYKDLVESDDGDDDRMHISLKKLCLDSVV